MVAAPLAPTVPNDLPDANGVYSRAACARAACAWSASAGEHAMRQAWAMQDPDFRGFY